MLATVYTYPSATAGVRPAWPTDVQSGWQSFGVPAQPVDPAASNTYSRSNPVGRSVPTYTTPFATAGEPSDPPIPARQSGLHSFGVPAQPVAPRASNA